MDGYTASTYGDRIADVYDELYGTTFDTESAVEFLAGLARGGPALELGVGTGRLAIPLVKREVEVRGVDASKAMIDRLRAKPGGEAVDVILQDFGQLELEGSFRLVYVVFNTFFALPTQEEQVRCFRRVAERLDRDGAFVVEAFVPDLARFDAYRQRVEAGEISPDRVHLDVARHDPVTQTIRGQRVVITEAGTALYPVSIRYAWPTELDLMARLAGLRLRERWGDWRRSPFTASSDRHVSVYGPEGD